MSSDDLCELVSSTSQAVARLAIECLDLLLQPSADLPDFLAFCVATVNDSDDVGLARRLITKILAISLPEGLQALGKIDLMEIGARRRLAGVLGAYEDNIQQSGLQAPAADLLARCLVKTTEDGWIIRGRELLTRLKAPDNDIA
jgi:hypothetical protein